MIMKRKWTGIETDTNIASTVNYREKRYISFLMKSVMYITLVMILTTTLIVTTNTLSYFLTGSVQAKEQEKSQQEEKKEKSGERPDRILADFNGTSYGDWKVEGVAFGKAPAKGTLSGQMNVTGYEGTGLVNSFVGGDTSVGKLTSPDFTIDRRNINFLLGGGGFQDSVYMALFVEGKEVRRATGPNLLPGGSEKLDPVYWDVSEFLGKKARIEIVDRATGGWGHLNVDCISLSDTYRGKQVRNVVRIEKTRDIKTEKRFLHFPIDHQGDKTYVRVEVNGKKVREYKMALAETADKTDFYGTLEVALWRGETIHLVAEHVVKESTGLDQVVASDELADSDSVYREKYRPQFHFAPRRGWTNDPNGLHFYNGVYHLFYQHNPFSTQWGNMTWGHATSPDLLHWTEGPDALCPDELGTIFSGSGIVDVNNTSGLAPKGSGLVPQIVFYTSHGPEARPATKVTQSMAWSLDGGKTWKKYAKNPVLPHIIGGNRDPKVFWYEPTKTWIMALYLDGEDYALFGSKNLTKWEEYCRIEKLGCSECPDMFELAVDGNKSNKKWVFWGGDGNYVLGSFDGRNFKKEAGPFRSKWGGNDYAAQTFYDLPDERRIQFSWMNGGRYPEMPFNQQFSVPRELTLKTTTDGIRLAFQPVKELESLRGTLLKEVKPDQKKKQNQFYIDNVPECFELEMTLDVSNLHNLRIGFFGQTIHYNTTTGKINEKAPLLPKEGKITIRLIVDRMSWELFANEGVTEFACCFIPEEKEHKKGTTKLILSADDNEIIGIESLKVWPLKSVWNTKP